MDQKKKERLEADGWTVGSVEDFLGLTSLQAAYADLTIYLAEEIKIIRKAKGLTQTALANMMGSSQSRIAKLERADPSVSFDLLLRAFINLEIPPQNLGAMIMSFAMEEDYQDEDLYLGQELEMVENKGVARYFEQLRYSKLLEGMDSTEKAAFASGIFKYAVLAEEEIEEDSSVNDDTEVDA